MSLTGRFWSFFGLPLLVGASLNIAANQINTSDDPEIERILSSSLDIAYGEYLAGECASCHSAAVVPGSNVPIIYGVTADYLVKALLEYRSGVRENTTMRNVAEVLGDEEIAVLAQYLATQKP